jgi:predicted N-formylglutamate amidohydrolase
MNEPYSISDETDYTIPVHGERRGIPHIEFEISQDLIETEDGQLEWTEFLAHLLMDCESVLDALVNGR